MQDTIVVAGGGHAAAQVVDSLRRDGYVNVHVRHGDGAIFGPTAPGG